MKIIKSGAKSRGALLDALGSDKETIHSVSKKYSETLKMIAEKLVHKNRRLAEEMFVNGYVDVDDTPTTSITQVWYGKYEREKQFDDSLNEDQKKAYHRAIATTEDLFINSGAGFGKTYLLARIASKLGPRCIVVAPTNAAVKVLHGEMPEESGVILSTIHKALNYSAKDINDNPEDSEEALDMLFESKNHGEKLAPVIIIDEAGMTSEDLIKEIKDRCDRVIFFGDLCQLEPVDADQYDFNNVETIELTIQMRQDFTDTGLYKTIQSFRKAIKAQDYTSGSFYFDDTLVSVESLASHFCEQKDIDVVGAYTNSIVIKTNEVIKKNITGRTSIQPGDEMLLYSPLVDEQKNSMAHNGEKVVVTEVAFNSYLGRSQYKFKGKLCESRMIFNTPKERYEYWETECKAKMKKIGWRTFSKISVIARPTYCRSIHKLQGTTFNVVGVNENNIKEKSFNLDSYNRLMYTALSRAKSKVYLMQ